jgi:phosphatidylinositol alpha-1,6-mannosyltransferase
MRILILTYEFPPVRGGIATYTAGLASAATRLGHEVVVGVSGTPKKYVPKDTDYPFALIRRGTGAYSVHKLPRLLWRAYRRAEGGKFDLVHAVDWPHIMALAYLNRLKKIPFVATVYGTEILLAPGSRQIKYLAGEKFFEAPDKIFAISDFTKRLLLKKNISLSTEKVTVTRPGVDFKYFSTPRADFDIHEKYSIPRDNKILLTVSRLDERKGHRSVLKALHKLKSELKRKVTYIIAGEGDNRTYIESLKSLAGDSGVNAIFTGRIDRDWLPSLYAAGDLFCMPGDPYPEKIEGFGLVYLEAAAAGLPSVASRIGGVPEAVLHEKSGILVEPGDIDALAAALIKMLEDDTFRKTMGAGAAEQARSLSWERCATLTYGIASRA